MELKETDGRVVIVTRRLLEQLRMMADWELRNLGYDPDSVTAACLKLDPEPRGNP